jgi:leucyl aminopeptidase
MLQILTTNSISDSEVIIYPIIAPEKELGNFSLEKHISLEKLKNIRHSGKKIIPFYGNTTEIYHFINLESNPFKTQENIRRAGYDLFTEIKSNGYDSITISNEFCDDKTALLYAEGLALSTYDFREYKTKPNGKPLSSIKITQAKEENIEWLNSVIEANFFTRDLVNRPLNYLNAEQLSSELLEVAKKLNFKAEVFNKSKIESLKMGGLLAVNMGSVDPPTFTILEYKPENAINSKPIVLVGKGVVYDTGGLSLKPTAGSMDSMKCDMAGAAAVSGIIYAAAKSKLPVHLVVLIPATDNRPSGNAITPGDVITISDGTTVEILNTDAEGRLILADALVYAQKYEPEMVFDFATLTGAAMRAIGTNGIVYMGSASNTIKGELEDCGFEVYERLVEFPLWDDYKEMIKSDIADLKNIGGALAGAITAGKFLEHFTNYPWLHFDIAGPAFLSGQDSYLGKNATAFGVRLVLEYLKRYCNK